FTRHAHVRREGSRGLAGDARVDGDADLLDHPFGARPNRRGISWITLLARAREGASEQTQGANAERGLLMATRTTRDFPVSGRWHMSCYFTPTCPHTFRSPLNPASSRPLPPRPSGESSERARRCADSIHCSSSSRALRGRSSW